MKKVLKVIGVLVVLVVIVGFLYPETNDFEESLVIKVPVERIFPLINDLKNWPKWSPWILSEPGMEIVYGDITAGKGAEYSWHADKMGDGRLWISESVENSSITTNIDFGGGEPPLGIYTFTKVEGGTKVSWRFINHNGWNPVTRLVSGLFITPMVKDSYIEGLENLSKVSVDNALP